MPTHDQNRRNQAAYRHRHAETLKKARRVAYSLVSLLTMRDHRWLTPNFRLRHLASVADELRECLTPEDRVQLSAYLVRPSAEVHAEIECQYRAMPEYRGITQRRTTG